MKNNLMKKLTLTCLTVCLCAVPAVTAGAEEAEELVESEELEEFEEIEESESLEETSESALFDYSTSYDANGDILIEFKEVEITLPASWEGKYLIETSDNYASFYHLGSYEKWEAEGSSGGWLFDICKSEYLDFLDAPSYRYVDDTADGYYYIGYATDMQGYTDDEDVLNEFLSLTENGYEVTETVCVKAEYEGDAHSDSDVYILPQSSFSYITEEDLEGLTKDEIQMAINEIYARHHRKFQTASVQTYFEAKPWYDGYIEPQDFDISEMNVYEKANIELMAAFIKK